MTPLVVRALVTQALVARNPVALDGLLASVVAQGRQYPPPELEYHDEGEIEVPLLKHAGGFYHSSEAHLVVAEYECRRWARKLPDLRSMVSLTSVKRLPTAGRYKAFWMPLRTTLPAGATVTWWAVGDVQEVASLLAHVQAIGAKRASGYGWVARWDVQECDEDRSLLREDGAPARPLPPELAPEGWRRVRNARLIYPYWRSEGTVLAAVPPLHDEALPWD